MSYFEDVPVGADEGDWWSWTDEEREEFLVTEFASIAEFDYERRGRHDTSGFFAHYAYDPACLALGHLPPTDENGAPLEGEALDDLDVADPLFRDGTHVTGWDGDVLCTETKYGQACTECEGECDYISTRIPDLWTHPGVLAS